MTLARALCHQRGRGVLARALAVALATVLLAGCALPARTPLGASQSEVLSQLGQPSARFALPDGERFLYSELPAGSAAYALDFDVHGQLVRNAQMLTQQRFESIPQGQYRLAEVLRDFGRPLLVEQVSSFEGDIYSYRFRQLSDLRRAHVHIDREGVVRHVMFTDEPLYLPEPRD